jgi:beta-aspartyl-peptidase (threonine type)
LYIFGVRHSDVTQFTYVFDGGVQMRLIDIPASGKGWSLVLHGGAGGRLQEFSFEEQASYGDGLRRAYLAGAEVLAAGGSAVDAVCATVVQLENNPVFNAGRGAALTSEGNAELDAALMAGNGGAGAVAVSRYAKNPIQLARRTMEESDHVLLVAPSEALAVSWGLDVVEPGYFVTQARQQQLAAVQSRELSASRHGTVGAVAVDSHGKVAAATSTGGMVGQHEGRVGDTPIIGAGTYARDGVVAVSCTGTGEAFIEGVVAHEVYARMHYARETLPDAVSATITAEIASRNADGGIIAVGADGRVCVGYNSTDMFAAFEDAGKLITLA